MEVKKTFVADGQKYRQGDKPPEMDKAKSDHYLRHGMIGPVEIKPARKAKPEENKAPGPQETK